MIRKLQKQDENIFFKLTEDFYNSEAVLHSIPEKNYVNTFNEIMRSNDYLECFILEHEGNTAGYALIVKGFSQESGGLVVWIDELFILPEYRSFGLGTELFKYVEANIPASRYRLEVEEENERAQSLYSRLGYKVLPYVQMVKE